MQKYAKVEDEETGIVSVGVGTNTAFYESIGMTLQDVEQGYDGAWYLASKVPSKPLEVSQEEKRNELKQKTDAFEQNLNTDMMIVSSLGYPMNADRRSQQNVNGQLIIMESTGLETISYRCGDNITRDLTAAQLKTLYSEILLNGNNLYQQKWAYEQQIANAQTAAECDAIEINFNMMDFSKEE